MSPTPSAIKLCYSANRPHSAYLNFFFNSWFADIGIIDQKGIDTVELSESLYWIKVSLCFHHPKSNQSHVLLKKHILLDNMILNFDLGLLNQAHFPLGYMRVRTPDSGSHAIPQVGSIAPD